MYKRLCLHSNRPNASPMRPRITAACAAITPTMLISLLYFLGLLTIDGENLGQKRLRIPNLTIKQLMYNYIREAFPFNRAVSGPIDGRGKYTQ